MTKRILRFSMVAVAMSLMLSLMPGCDDDEQKLVDGPWGPDLWYTIETNNADSTWQLSVKMLKYGANPTFTLNGVEYTVSSTDEVRLDIPPASLLVMDMETATRHVIDSVKVMSYDDLAAIRLDGVALGAVDTVYADLTGGPVFSWDHVLPQTAEDSARADAMLVERYEFGMSAGHLSRDFDYLYGDEAEPAELTFALTDSMRENGFTFIAGFLLRWGYDTKEFSATNPPSPYFEDGPRTFDFFIRRSWTVLPVQPE